MEHRGPKIAGSIGTPFLTYTHLMRCLMRWMVMLLESFLNYFGRPFSLCRASGRSEHTGVYDHLMPFVHRHIRDGILNGSYPLHPLTVAVAMPPPRTTRYLPQVKLFTGKRVPSALGWDQRLLKLSYQPSTGTTGIPHHD